MRERDAHAWAEIYFPGIGWQGFDPTASVPLAGEARDGGSWLEVARQHAFELGLLAAVHRRCSPSPAPELPRPLAPPASAPARAWAAAYARAGSSASAARRAGPACPAETPREYASALARYLARSNAFAASATTLDVESFSPSGASRIGTRESADAVLSSLGP